MRKPIASRMSEALLFHIFGVLGRSPLKSDAFAREVNVFPLVGVCPCPQSSPSGWERGVSPYPLCNYLGLKNLFPLPSPLLEELLLSSSTISIFLRGNPCGLSLSPPCSEQLTQCYLLALRSGIICWQNSHSNQPPVSLFFSSSFCR